MDGAGLDYALEADKFDPFSYKQISSARGQGGPDSNSAGGVYGSSNSKKKNQSGITQSLRPRRALCCLSLGNPIRRGCIALVEWKYLSVKLDFQ